MTLTHAGAVLNLTLPTGQYLLGSSGGMQSEDAAIAVTSSHGGVWEIRLTLSFIHVSKETALCQFICLFTGLSPLFHFLMKLGGKDASACDKSQTR